MKQPVAKAKNPRHTPAILVALIALPALTLAVLILLYGVDVPHRDEWSTVALNLNLRDGTLAFKDLVAQHNEHRIFFSRLISLLVNFVAQGNMKAHMFVSLMLAALSMWSVYRLARLTLPEYPRRFVAPVFLASLLVFGPIQYQNWLWGFQFQLLTPVACLTTALAFALSDHGPWKKLLVAVALTIIATFSFANGMICWVLMLPVLLPQFRNAAAKIQASAAWLLAATASIAAYFHNYYLLPGRPNPMDVIASPLVALQCFFGFLGAPLGIGDSSEFVKVADTVGILGLLLSIAVLVKLFCVRMKPGILPRCGPWLVLIAFALASAAITTFGRGLSAMRLLDSRYTSFSSYLYVGLIFLLTILFSENSRVAVRVLAILLATLYLITSAHAIGEMRKTRIDRLESKACLAFIDIIDDVCQTERLEADVVTLQRRANALQILGYLRPGLIQSRDVRRIAGSADGSSKLFGAFESLVKVNNGFYRAMGWAILPGRSEPADAVVLTYQRPDGEPVMFALVDQMAPRPDVEQGSGESRYERSGWVKWFVLPAGATVIQAWAYDALKGQAFLLNGDHRVAEASPLAIQFKVPYGTYDPGDGGVFESLVPAPPYLAQGWAVIKKKHKPADDVLLTCGETRLLVAAGPPMWDRPDVTRAMNEPGFWYSGWTARVNPASVPASGCDVRAWAFDEESNEAWPLLGKHPMPGPK